MMLSLLYCFSIRQNSFYILQKKTRKFYLPIKEFGFCVNYAVINAVKLTCM